MKRKVGELNNIPIVEGDPNLLKSNEILHKGGGQLSKRDNTGEIKDLGSSGGGDSEDSAEYYKLNILSEAVMFLAPVIKEMKYATVDEFKELGYDKKSMIIGYSLGTPIALRYNSKEKQAENYLNSLLNSYNRYSPKNMSCIEMAKTLIMSTSDSIGEYPTEEEAEDLVFQYITPITKEEFYDLNNI